jgi:hypothetical protein
MVKLNKNQKYKLNNWTRFFIGAALTSIGIGLANHDFIAFASFFLITGIGTLLATIFKAGMDIQ